MMKTSTFIGKALYSCNKLKGFIFGQKEQYYNGIHFQIQEFCVNPDDQHRGYGKALLRALEEELSRIGAVNICLITSRGERTEGWYEKRGFTVSGDMILMTKG